MGLLLRMVMRGVMFAAIAVIGCGVYGLFAGVVLPLAMIAKIAGIVFAVGCVLGLAK